MARHEFIDSIGRWTTITPWDASASNSYFPLTLTLQDFFLVVCSWDGVLGEASNIWPPNVSQFIVLEIVLAWDAWPSRVPTIASLMTSFSCNIKKPKILCHTFLVCDDAFHLGCLVPQDLEWI
jgi:hypothetical protein